jgi:hypothetical protein
MILIKFIKKRYQINNHSVGQGMMYITVGERVETDGRGILIEEHRKMMETHAGGRIVEHNTESNDITVNTMYLPSSVVVIRP